MKLTRIDILSAAKMLGAIMAMVGLVAGILYSFGGLAIDGLVSLGWVASTETPGLGYGTVLAFGALIGMPIIFAIPGLIVGALLALLYNVAAERVGGIDVDIKKPTE